MLKRIAGVIYKRFRWIPIAWSWFWPVTQFALIFPAEMDDPNAPGPGTGNSWDTFGIANTGTVGLDLSTINFTCQLGNNNLPGPADFHCGYLGQSFVVNPGEFTGDSLGFSLAAIQSMIPQVTSINNSKIFDLNAIFLNDTGTGGPNFVNTTSDLNFALTVSGVSASFTTVYKTGSGENPSPPFITIPGYVYST
jgi:hypothetical protein